MTWEQGGELALQVAMGTSLAACAGLRAFLPLWVVGIAGRLEIVPLSAAYDWLQSWPALTIFGVAVLVELVSDKFPVVDNLLDMAQTLVKPCAGALVMATVVSDWSPLYLTVVSVLIGGSVAGFVHLTKTKLRLVSTASTAGIANPALSAVEDVGALTGTAVSIVAPLLVVLLVIALVTLAWIVLRRARRLTAQSEP